MTGVQIMTARVQTKSSNQHRRPTQKETTKEVKSDNTEQGLIGKFKGIMGVSLESNVYDKELYMLYKEMIENIDMMLMLDGVYVPTTQTKTPKNKEHFEYLAKKKLFSNHTNILINSHGVTIFKSKSVSGSISDLKLLQEDIPVFSKFSSLLGYKKVRLFVDGSYHGIEKFVDGMNIMIPYKQKNSDMSGGLTQKEQDYNKLVNHIRNKIERTIRMTNHQSAATATAKQHRKPSRQTDQDRNILTGLANFHNMWGDIQSGKYKLGKHNK